MNDRNETYGVQIDADTSKFKSKMKGLSDDIRIFGKRVKAGFGGAKDEAKRQAKEFVDSFKPALKEIQNGMKNFGKRVETDIKVKPDLDYNGFEKQIAYIERQLDDLRKKIKLENVPIEARETYKQLSMQLDEIEKKIKEIENSGANYDIVKYDKLIESRERIEKNLEKLQAEPGTEKSTKQLQLEAQYERLQAEYNDLIEKQEDFNNGLEETEKISLKASSSLSNMFDKSISKIKRFTFYLLGARSVFSLFMKYQGIYYQYNEQMQYQSELSQNAIALSLAPAFEFLGNMIAYASIAFAKFIELLTGVNVLSKVSTKGIRDYNKSLKETQTLVSGIDEITNLTNPQNLGLASQYKALEDFQKKVEEVEEFFQKNTWVQDLANGLKKVFEWFGKIYTYIRDHWDVFKYIIGGVVISSLLGGNNIAFKISVLGLTTFLSLIDAINEYNKAKAEYDKNHRETTSMVSDLFHENVNNLLTDTETALKGTQKGTKEWESRIKDVKAQLPSILYDIKDGEMKYEEYKPVLDEIRRRLEDLDKEEFAPEIRFLMSLDGDKEDIELLKAYYATGSPDVKMSYGGGGSGAFGSGTFGSDTEETRKLKKVATSGIVEETKKIFSMFGIKLATGLDYVPYDNYPALLHKGETVVPAKYNPTIHSIGNEETNQLLETLIIKVDDLRNRPNQFNIDGKQLARATYPLLQAESRNYTYNEGVKR